MHLANGKYVFWVFMDLEKAYDTTDRHWYVGDANSVRSCRKGVESSAELSYRKQGMCSGGK